MTYGQIEPTAPTAPPAPAQPEADVALEYHQLHRARGRKVWKSVVGALLSVFLGFAVVPVLWLVVFVVGGVLLGDRDPERFMNEVSGAESMTPWTMAYLFLTLASLIPAVWLVNRLMHGLRLGWVTSVFGRMRWKYFFVCLGLSVLALAATLAVSSLTPQDAVDAGATTEINDFTRRTLDFLILVVLLVPLQAAGEEYLFRGYLTQAFGGLFSSPWVSRTVAVVVPAVLFALAHGAQDPPIFVDRLAFGLVAGVLVIVTGGLEAAIAMHVLNNYVAFSLALAFTDIDSALEPTAGTWWTLPSTLTQSFVYLALAVWAGRHMGLANSVWGAVLQAPKRAV